MLGNKTGLSIKKFLESLLAVKHPKYISKGNKAAAAEAAVSGSDSRRSHSRGRLRGVKVLSAQFEALGGGALTMASLGLFVCRA